MKIEIIKNERDFGYKPKGKLIKVYDTLNGHFLSKQYGFSEFNENTHKYEDTSNRDLEYFNLDHTPEKFVAYLNYPLSVVAKAEFEARSNLEMAEKIGEAYHQIYDEENNSSSIEEGYRGNSYNRNSTNGKYGIWGHHLGDLILEGVELYEGNEIHVYIGS